MLYTRKDEMPIVGGHPHSGIGEYTEATPEEISQTHGKCGTCSYYGVLHTEPWNECLNPKSPYFARHDGMIDKDKDYCRFYEDFFRNHEPKET